MFYFVLMVSMIILPILIRCYLLYGNKSKDEVCIVVLGDIGRSPRMQYHALSFVQEGYSVNIVGYGGSKPFRDVRNSSKIKLHNLVEPPGIIQKLPRLGVYAVKTIWQAITLFLVLMLIKKPNYLLLQNPPAIPTMIVCWVVCVLRDTRYVIDWHNYGHTIMSLTLGKQHPLTRFAKFYEEFLGIGSNDNLCVTKAMKEDLEKNWGVKAVTMYDRPPVKFKRTPIDERHKLFNKLATDYEVFRPRETELDCERTVFTEKTFDGKVSLLDSRPVLLVSSTSWTEDEDFSILFNALQKYEEAVEAEDSFKFPDIVCVITGKGPLKDYYTKKISSVNWNYIKVCTPWLEAEDYPLLLGSADIGVCLHMSSSGLDLPMKVVDMFGSGLPVCAVHFKCLHELVKDGENGRVFKTEEELAEQLQELLEGFPSGCDKLEKYRENLQAFQQVRWDATWRENVLPIFT